MTLLEPPSPEATATDLLETYQAALTAALDGADRERAVTETGLDDATLAGIADQDLDRTADLTLEEAASVLALDGEDADALVAGARDELLLGMTSAVMDVERLAATLELDLDPKEIQAKVEGRHPMTIREYAALRAALA